MVTRETSIAAGLRGLGLNDVSAPKLAIFLDAVENEAIPLGLISEAERTRLVPRHVLESAALVPFLQDSTSIVDVGPGAGFPGIVVATILDRPVTLVDSNARSSAFLRRILRELDLPGEVVQLPAEEAGRTPLREASAAAVSRALAPPEVALELTLPLVCIGGHAAFLVGPSAREADPATKQAAATLGGAAPRYVSVKVPGVLVGTWVMIVGKVDSTPERYPRRPGVPRRRPLGHRVTGVK